MATVPAGTESLGVFKTGRHEAFGEFSHIGKPGHEPDQVNQVRLAAVEANDLIRGHMVILSHKLQVRTILPPINAQESGLISVQAKGTVEVSLQSIRAFSFKVADGKNEGIIKDQQRPVGWGRVSRIPGNGFRLDGKGHPPDLLIDLLADLIAKFEEKATVTHIVRIAS